MGRPVNAAPDPTPPGSQPNIILILTDDLDAASVDSMPNILSLLANQGVSFSNYFVNVSVCVPSRVTTLVGQAAHNHEVYTNLPPEGGFKKFNESGQENSTIATWLQAAGYRTALFGKYMNGYPDRGNQTYIPPGWTEWYGTIKRYFDYRINENGQIVNYGLDPEDYETDVLSAKVTDFIKRNPPGSPFFVYLAPDAPHRPATPAPRHENRFPTAQAPRNANFGELDITDKPDWVHDLHPLTANQINRIDDLYRKRLQSMLAVDEMVRSIIDTLASIGQLENTYILFTSDHGFHQGEHRIQQGKQTPYQETVRVPLFVRGPGIPAGEVVDYLSSNIDLAPTFLDLAGAPQQTSVDGKSLVPLLGTDPLPETWRVALLIEHWHGGEGIPTVIPEYKALRTREHLYVEYVTDEFEFYDMNTDLFQVDCIMGWTDSSLVALLDGMRDCEGEDCFPTAFPSVGAPGRSFKGTSEELRGGQYPGTSSLRQNYPNPFNPKTEITFEISDHGYVMLEVYNLLGERVATLVNQDLPPGQYSRKFNAENLSSGTYLYRLSVNGFVQTRRLVLIR
jgi:arylsulfatase A-like enzyme